MIAGIKTSAIDARYKNNLLNVELSQTPDNRVSVLLVFEKPYTEPVKVIYKTDNEYNILLPETYHSITSVSTLNALNIRSANVKLVPYFNQDNSNGYTKITLQTTRPVIFNAHASYITTQIAQNDLIEKIEQDETLKITPTKVALQTNPVSKPVKAQKTTVKQAKKIQSVAKQPQKVAQKPVQVSKPKDAVQAKPQVVEKQPVNIAQGQSVEVKKVETIEKIEDIKQEENVEQIASVPETMDDVNSTTELATSQVSPAQVSQSSTVDFVSVIKDNINQPLTIIVGALLMLFVLLARISRRKPSQQMSRTIIPPHYNYEEELQTQDISQELKDLSWQEKYKLMKEKEARLEQGTEAQYSEIQVVETNNSNEEVAESVYDEQIVSQVEVNDAPVNSQTSEFSGVVKPSIDEVLNAHELQENIIANLRKSDEKLDPFGFNNPPVNEGFESAHIELDNLNDISDLEPTVDEVYKSAPYAEEIEAISSNIEINETKATNPIEPTLINHAKISKTKGFYLVRYEDEVALMGYINEQIFLLHNFNNKRPSFVQTRLTEKKKGSEVYLVRTENFKSLIKVTKDNMQTVLNL